MSGRLRWGFVLLSLGAPIVWLSPGCGARSDVDDASATSGTGGDEGRGGMAPDAQPDGVPLDSPPDLPGDVLVDVPFDSRADVSFDAPADVPFDVPSDGACPDADGDGYTICDEDCDDANPAVNPGAFDFPNGIDDDCDGSVDEPILGCGAGLQYASQDPFDYARAIDICQSTSAVATGKAKTWGLITAELRLADGSGSPAPQAHSIITKFGSVLAPRKNGSFAFFSTGLAATPGQPYFQSPTPEPGTGLEGVPGVPAPPGFPTNKQGCPLPRNAMAHDSVNLKVTIRVPTNAHSFGFDHAFFSAEYPEWACSQYNDLWVVLLGTGASGIANNKDIVFDSQGTPGSVNLNFFDRCVAGPTGCSGVPGFSFCSGGKSELKDTGYGDPASPCGAPSTVGGGTGWLTTEAEVLPGETITVQFMVWDSSDSAYDSSAIFDNFHWLQGSLPNPKTERAQ